MPVYQMPADTDRFLADCDEEPRTTYDFDGTLEAACDEEPPAQSEWVADTFGESFAPPDPASAEAEDVADWVLRKVLESRAQQARIKAGSATRLKREKSREEGLIYSLGAWLRQFVEARKGARKSVLLESGSVALRAKKARIEIRDATALALWALTQAPEIVTWTFKGEVPIDAPASLLGCLLPKGARYSIQFPVGWDPNKDAPTATIASGAHGTYEVKPADAQAYFERTGDLPHACEFVPAGDDLYLAEPRAAK